MVEYNARLAIQKFWKYVMIVGKIITEHAGRWQWIYPGPKYI